MSWIAEDEKYALVGMSVKLDESFPLTLTPHHWVMTDAGFTIPSEWREWLGSMRVRELQSGNLFLISKMPSTAPDVLDGENQTLLRRVADQLRPKLPRLATPVRRSGYHAFEAVSRPG